MAFQFSYQSKAGTQVLIPLADLPSYAEKGIATLNGETMFASAYWQVTSVSVTKAGGTAHLIVYSDSSKASVVDSKFIEFAYDLNGPNPIKQAYQFLKTLPEFSDAVDC
jgi:hypothetical protein